MIDVITKGLIQKDLILNEKVNQKAQSLLGGRNYELGISDE